MAHIEFDFVPIYLSGDVLEMPVSLDCWKASIVFLSPKKSDFTIDGIPWNCLYDTVGNIPFAERIELGGCVANGSPVNIKHVLHFTTERGSPFQVLIVRQYYIQ